jgi:hypothetical protein
VVTQPSCICLRKGTCRVSLRSSLRTMVDQDQRDSRSLPHLERCRPARDRLVLFRPHFRAADRGCWSCSQRHVCWSLEHFSRDRLRNLQWSSADMGKRASSTSNLAPMQRRTSGHQCFNLLRAGSCQFAVRRMKVHYYAKSSLALNCLSVLSGLSHAWAYCHRQPIIKISTSRLGGRRDCSPRPPSRIDPDRVGFFHDPAIVSQSRDRVELQLG